jgi:imidazolonepropionase-like amidohydrolase
MTFLAMVVESGGRYGQEMIQLDVGRMKRHFDRLIRVVERCRQLGIKVLCGTDTGNNVFMPFGELHAKELEIFVTYCGFTPMEAIVAATRDNAFAMGLPDDLGVLEAGRLADVLILTADPLGDIRVLQGGKHVAAIVKGGKVIDRERLGADAPLAFS